MRVIAKRGGEGDVDAGAGEIDCHIEGIAATGEAETAVAAAHELDSRLSDGDDARVLCSLMVLQA